MSYRIVLKNVYRAGDEGKPVLALKRGDWIPENDDLFAELGFTDEKSVREDNDNEGTPQGYMVVAHDAEKAGCWGKLLVPHENLSDCLSSYADLWLIHSIDEAQGKITLLKVEEDPGEVIQVLDLAALIEMLGQSLVGLKQQEQTLILHSAEISGAIHYAKA